MDQQTSRWIAQLEAEFAEPNGFVWKARYGDFDPEHAPLERRLVSIVWFLPLLMMWQEERISARGGGSFTYKRLVERVTEAVIEILGVP
jgi:hypothetical protein